MKVLRNIQALNKAINKNLNLGFVPTMGGIHKGHISLINLSKKKCEKTLVSIYINPKQFNKKTDFSKYPRNLKKDLMILKKCKIDYVFLPNDHEIYKKISTTKIVLPPMEKVLCAKFRKGHFEGVLNVMNRFLTIIKPKYLFMGEKDFQQLYLVDKYVARKYKVKTYNCKTIRDKKFFALSSRNLLLTQKNLTKSGLIAKEIFKIKKIINKRTNLKLFLVKQKLRLEEEFLVKVEYLEARNLKVAGLKSKTRLFIAYYINKIRLIDNF